MLITVTLNRSYLRRQMRAKTARKTLTVVLIAIATGGVVVGCYCSIPAFTRALATKLGDILLDGFGPGASDYSFQLIDEFGLIRTSSRSRMVFGPSHQTGPESGSQIWVDADVTRLGWNDRYIVCFQSPSELAVEDQVSGWWIVDAKALGQYGPFTEDAYRAMLQELGIDPPIQVRPIKAYGRTGRLADTAK